MADHVSLEHLTSFARQIEQVAADPAQERFVRGFLAGAVQDCPVDALKEIASCVLSIRRRELEREAKGN